MCLLCPCKSEIPVKFSSLCFCGERQKVPSFLHVLHLLLPSLEHGRDCSAAVLMQQLHTGFRLQKANVPFLWGQRVPLPGAARAAKRRGCAAAPTAPAAGSLERGLSVPRTWDAPKECCWAISCCHSVAVDNLV